MVVHINGLLWSFVWMGCYGGLLWFVVVVVHMNGLLWSFILIGCYSRSYQWVVMVVWRCCLLSWLFNMNGL